MRRLLHFIDTRPQGVGKRCASCAAHLLDALPIGPYGAALAAVIVAQIERSFDRVQVLMQTDMDLMLPA